MRRVLGRLAKFKILLEELLGGEQGTSEWKQYLYGGGRGKSARSHWWMGCGGGKTKIQKGSTSGWRKWTIIRAIREENNRLECGRGAVKNEKTGRAVLCVLCVVCLCLACFVVCCSSLVCCVVLCVVFVLCCVVLCCAVLRWVSCLQVVCVLLCVSCVLLSGLPPFVAPTPRDHPVPDPLLPDRLPDPLVPAPPFVPDPLRQTAPNFVFFFLLSPKIPCVFLFSKLVACDMHFWALCVNFAPHILGLPPFWTLLDRPRDHVQARCCRCFRLIFPKTRLILQAGRHFFGLMFS